MLKINTITAKYMSIVAFAFIMLFSISVNAQIIKTSNSIPEGSTTVVNEITGKGYSRQSNPMDISGGAPGASNPAETLTVGTGKNKQVVVTPGKSDPLFTHLAKKASEIFMGLREIIYVVAAFGILGVAIGGFFGNINWKWFGAIAIGLMVIAVTSSLIKYLIGDDAMTYIQISDSLK